MSDGLFMVYLGLLHEDQKIKSPSCIRAFDPFSFFLHLSCLFPLLYLRCP